MMQMQSDDFSPKIGLDHHRPRRGVVDKARFLNVVRNQTVSHEAMDSDDIRARVYGDAATVTAPTAIKGKFVGKGFTTKNVRQTFSSRKMVAGSASFHSRPGSLRSKTRQDFSFVLGSFFCGIRRLYEHAIPDKIVKIHSPE